MTGHNAEYVIAAYAVATVVLAATVLQSWLAARRAEKETAGGGANNDNA